MIIDVDQTGILELQVIAPSSHGEPPGRIWIDDIALYETSMPPLISISENVGFNDEPAMAASADGSIYVAWNSFRNGSDSLQLMRMTIDDTTLEPAGSWQLVGRSTAVANMDMVPMSGS